MTDPPAGLILSVNKYSMTRRSKPESWHKRLTTWKTALGALTTVFGVYAGAAAIGLEVPRFAWVSEVEAQARRVDMLAVRIEQTHLESLVRQWSDMVTRIAELEAKKVGVPQAMLAQERDLQNQISAAKNRLNEMDRELRRQK